MKNKWTFRFRQNRPSTGKPMTLEEAERHFLAKLNDSNEDQQAARRELVQIYRTMCRASDAMYHAQEYLAHTTDLEERAEMFFFLGQVSERMNDFESAVRFYKIALELEPRSDFYAYFVRNNLGYSLNQLDRYVDAEKHLRRAIEIDPNIANAHKNLGLSLEGQGRNAEAVQSYIAAIQANASDSRALKHLEELANRQRELFAEIPDLRYQINMCRQAVAFASARNLN